MAHQEFIDKKYRSLVGLMIICPILFPAVSLAYSDATTHRAVTNETAKVFNHYYPEFSLGADYVAKLIKGSYEEDKAPRWLNHFYDPVYNKGFKGLRSSKVWVEDTNAQARRVIDANFVGEYFRAENDYSWERAIFDYVYGDKGRAMEALGHVLHLVQDATVPDHTRDDAHPVWSTYENYSKQYDLGNLNLAQGIIRDGQAPFIYPKLEDYFDNLAKFSNNNFFSDDTILINKYKKPILISEKYEIVEGKGYNFSYGSLSGIRLLYVDKIRDPRTGVIKISYTLTDPKNKIPQDYWDNLSKQAVLGGVGVIKLFFEEVEKEKVSKRLWEKNKSLATRFLESLDSKLGGLLASLSTLPPAPVPQVITQEEEGEDGEASPDQINNLWQAVLELKKQLEIIIAEREEQSGDDLSRQTVDFSVVTNQIISGGAGGSSGGGGGSGDLVATTSPVEVVVPTPQLVSPDDLSQIFSTTTVTFIGSSTPGLIIFSDFGGDVATTTLAGDWGLTLNDLPQGTTTINFFARDVEGNISLPLAVSVQIDSVPLSLNLDISECSNSWSDTYCLLSPISDLTLSWKVSRTGDYTYEVLKYFYDSQSDNEDGFATTSIILGLASSTLGVPTGYDWARHLFLELRWQVVARDVATGKVVASSPVQITFFHPRPVVINEISWAGTTASPLDEWFELRSFLPVQSLNLNNFFVTDINNTWRVDLNGDISAQGHYLIERASDEVIQNRQANLMTNWGDPEAKSFSLNQVGLKLYQKRAGEEVLIDETPVWDKSLSGPGTLERTWEHKVSTDLATWEVNEGCNSSDGPCALDRNMGETFGTPGVINTASIPRLW